MRKIMKFIVSAILFPALIVSTALLVYLHFFADSDRNLSGEWTASLDMTDQAAVTALGWRQDIGRYPFPCRIWRMPCRDWALRCG